MSSTRLWSLIGPVLLLCGWLGMVFLFGTCGWLPTPRTVVDTLPPPATPTLPPSEPTATVSSTLAKPTQKPTATSTPERKVPDAEFVLDVTVPDGTEFAPGEYFDKVWRIRSSGSGPWPEGIRLVFASGDQMGAPNAVPVPKTALGSTADIKVTMQAPAQPGSYKGVWQLEDQNGHAIGDRVVVIIVVPAPPSVSFVADRYLITKGECVTISWLAENVTAVYYQDSGVTGSGGRVECPISTTLYELRVQYPNDNWESFYITITVNPGY